MIHGTGDTVVPYAISENLSSNLTAEAIYNELHPLEGYEHYPIMAGGIYDTNLVDEIIRYMIAFAKLWTDNLQPAMSIRLGGQCMQGANGYFIFDVTGPTNTTVVVEQSANLMTTWQPAATNQLFGGTAMLTNIVSANSQFYRGRTVSP